MDGDVIGAVIDNINSNVLASVYMYCRSWVSPIHRQYLLCAT